MPRLVLLFILAGCLSLSAAEDKTRRLLYAAMPGVRNYLEYGGHGLLVFDRDNDHKFVKRIPTKGFNSKGLPSNVKGICASAKTGKLYISTLEALSCIDLRTEKVDWEKEYAGGCDRMAISPDGKTIYLPSLEKEFWNVVDALTGEVKAKIVTNSGAHNTIYGPDGKEVYMAGLKSPYLYVADTSTHTISHKVGPFTKPIRPFTINGSQTLVFVNINELLGFEIGDLKSHKMLHRIEVQGFKKGPVKRHGCPSHGIALTKDEEEIWLTDAANSRLHIFDNTKMPPTQKQSIVVRDQPGWITFSIDGKLAYPSTGDVIDVASKKIIATLTDEKGTAVQSEKMLEVIWSGSTLVDAGNQFALSEKR